MALEIESQPVFPLPNVVLFPKALLPLHVFEPRYRLMMEEVLRGNQSICMALLKPGWERDYYGNPDVYAIGCVGRVLQHRQRSDGRYDLVLHGEYKVAIEEFERDQPFRVARVRRIEEDAAWLEREEAGGESRGLLSMFRRSHEKGGTALDMAQLLGPHLGAASILNTIAMNLNLDPADKQRLLEMETAELRYRAVFAYLTDALATRQVLDDARHRLPPDPRSN